MKIIGPPWLNSLYKHPQSCKVLTQCPPGGFFEYIFSPSRISQMCVMEKFGKDFSKEFIDLQTLVITAGLFALGTLALFAIPRIKASLGSSISEKPNRAKIGLSKHSCYEQFLASQKPLSLALEEALSFLKKNTSQESDSSDLRKKEQTVPENIRQKIFELEQKTEVFLGKKTLFLSSSQERKSQEPGDQTGSQALSDEEEIEEKRVIGTDLIKSLYELQDCLTEENVSLKQLNISNWPLSSSLVETLQKCFPDLEKITISPHQASIIGNDSEKNLSSEERCYLIALCQKESVLQDFLSAKQNPDIDSLVDDFVLLKQHANAPIVEVWIEKVAQEKIFSLLWPVTKEKLAFFLGTLAKKLQEQGLSLKTLHIEGLALSPTLLQQILQTFPDLEHLELSEEEALKALDDFDPNTCTKLAILCRKVPDLCKIFLENIQEEDIAKIDPTLRDHPLVKGISRDGKEISFTIEHLLRSKLVQEQFEESPSESWPIPFSWEEMQVFLHPEKELNNLSNKGDIGIILSRIHLAEWFRDDDLLQKHMQTLDQLGEKYTISLEDWEDALFLWKNLYGSSPPSPNYPDIPVHPIEVFLLERIGSHFVNPPEEALIKELYRIKDKLQDQAISLRYIDLGHSALTTNLCSVIRKCFPSIVRIEVYDRARHLSLIDEYYLLSKKQFYFNAGYPSYYLQKELKQCHTPEQKIAYLKELGRKASEEGVRIEFLDLENTFLSSEDLESILGLFPHLSYLSIDLTDDLIPLLAKSPIEKLRIESCSREAAQIINQLKNIKIIYLDIYTKETNIDQNFFKNLPENLEKLRIIDAGDLLGINLSHLKKLKKIEITNKRIGIDKAFLENLPENIEEVSIYISGDLYGVNLSHLKKLKKIEIRNNHIDIDKAFLENLPENIEEVRCPRPNEGVLDVSGINLSRLKKLKKISLDEEYTGIDKAFLENLPENIEEVSCYVSGDLYGVNLSHLKKLKKIEIRNNHIDIDKAFLENLPENIEEVRCPSPNEGVLDVSGINLSRLKKLKNIYLDKYCTGIGKYFLENLPKNLEVLVCLGSGDVSGTNLSRLKKLKKISLSKDITGTDDAFFKKLPKKIAFTQFY